MWMLGQTFLLGQTKKYKQKGKVIKWNQSSSLPSQILKVYCFLNAKCDLVSIDINVQNNFKNKFRPKQQKLNSNYYAGKGF